MTDTRQVKVMTVEEWRAALQAQGKERIEDVTFRCPSCGTLQSAQDFIDIGMGDNLQEVEQHLAFSCIGRFTKTKGCKWTLGGLFQIHELEVQTSDGKRHPKFIPAMEDGGAQ